MIRRSRSLLPAVAFGLGAFLLPLALGAAVYYVAPFASGGRDTNLGTLGQPWETLQHAADTVGPGDTVYARAGGYAGFQMTTSGLSAARIVFTNYPGETVSIVSDLPVRHDGINLEGASYITVRGFHVNGAGHAGIRAVACNGVEIVGNVLTNNQVWGVLTGCCDDVRVTGNIAAGSIEQHGIYVSNSGDRPVIVGNVVYGNNQNGIHMNGDIDTPCDSGGTTFDGVISGALVEGNTLFDNGANGGVGGGSAINCDGVQTSLIRNNLVYASHASGISLYQIDGAQPASGNRVENNTVLVAAGTGRWALNIQDDAANTVVRNNILWSSRAPRGAMAVCATCFSGFSSDYNVLQDVMSDDGGNSSFLTVAQWRANTGQDAHSRVLANATELANLFVSQPGANYHLRPGSAALDAGTTIADLVRDLDSRRRPVGALWDAGAYEGVNGLFGDGFEGGSTLRWAITAP